MSKYLLIEGLRVRRFQMLQNTFLASGVPLFASCMFTHALCARLGVTCEGTVLVIHEVTPDVESIASFRSKSGKTFTKEIIRSQRGACGYQIGRGNGGDYSSKNPLPQSRTGQPSITGRGDFSLLIRVNDAPEAEVIERFLENFRFAGGTIDSVDNVAVLNELPRFLPFGKVVVDATPLVEDRLASGMSIEQAIFANAPKPVDEDGEPIGPAPVLIPVNFGYALLSQAKPRLGSRSLPPSASDQTHQAFGEPALAAPAEGVIGLIHLKSSKAAWSERRDYFWRLNWHTELDCGSPFELCVLKQAA